jgi:hypothetical protein
MRSKISLKLGREKKKKTGNGQRVGLIFQYLIDLKAKKKINQYMIRFMNGK